MIRILSNTKETRGLYNISIGIQTWGGYTLQVTCSSPSTVTQNRWTEQHQCKLYKIDENKIIAILA